jgi:uncharacterized protein with HEPN domain
MMDRLRLYLDQMHMAATDVHTFSKGMDQTAFMSDLLVQRAVGMSLIMLGEAGSRLFRRYPEFVADHPEIAWSEMLGMRNRVAHGYFEIDLKVVWETAQYSLPKLLDQLDAIRHWRAQGE